MTVVAKMLQMIQPTVRRHLEFLKHAGFLHATKSGKWIFYSRDEIVLDG
ncbi:ArsR family transcriptional regulator [Delftia acidovorans]